MLAVGPCARGEHRSRGRAVTLFTTTTRRRLQGDEPVRVAPPRRVIVGWVAHRRRRRRSRSCSALVPAPYVIEQPGPVFNTLGTDQQVGARRQGRQAAHHHPRPEDLPDRGLPRPADGLGGRQPRAAPELVRDRRRLVRPEQGRAARSTPSSRPDVTTEQSNAAERGPDGRLAAGRDRRGPQRARLHFPQHVAVEQLIKGSPADGVLKEGDEITAVNGDDGRRRRRAARRRRRPTARTSRPRSASCATAPRRRSPITPIESSGRRSCSASARGMDYTFPFDVEDPARQRGRPERRPDVRARHHRQAHPGRAQRRRERRRHRHHRRRGQRRRRSAASGRRCTGRATPAPTTSSRPQSNCDEVIGHVPPGSRCSR